MPETLGGTEWSVARARGALRETRLAAKSVSNALHGIRQFANAIFLCGLWREGIDFDPLEFPSHGAKERQVTYFRAPKTEDFSRGFVCLFGSHGYVNDGLVHLVPALPDTG